MMTCDTEWNDCDQQGVFLGGNMFLSSDHTVRAMLPSVVPIDHGGMEVSDEDHNSVVGRFLHGVNMVLIVSAWVAVVFHPPQPWIHW